MKRSVMAGTVLIWLLVAGSLAYDRIITYSTFPRPTDYEKQWDFQLAMFAITGLPLLSLGLVVLLGVELWLFSIFKKRDDASDTVPSPENRH